VLLAKCYWGLHVKIGGWARHVARTREKENAYRILVRKAEGERHWEVIVIDGYIILKLILEK
jgi:hypothetical protein